MAISHDQAMDWIDGYIHKQNKFKARFSCHGTCNNVEPSFWNQVIVLT